jgi:molecular chaperone GrpE (heat shock protein)
MSDKKKQSGSMGDINKTNNQAAKNTVPTSINTELDNINNRIKELEDKNLRLRADIQNLHTQSALDAGRARTSAKKIALEPVVQFLSTMSLAFQHAPKTESDQTTKFVDALKSSYERLIRELEAINITIIVPKAGDEYDPVTMQALSATDENSTVKHIVKLGLKVEDTVAYPAIVML